MKSEYCVVGPTYVLLGEGDRDAGDWLALDARARGGQVVAKLTAALRGDEAVRMHAPAVVDHVAPAGVTELVRLFARVCADFWSYRFPLEIVLTHRDIRRDALRADGFSSSDGTVWVREPAPFPARERKANTMEEVYQDLFTVPWNFVPRESDAFGPMLADGSAPGTTVLDLGSGLGKNVGPLESRGFAVYGVDPSYAAIRRCREIVASPHRFIVATAAALPWRDACFERVLDIGSLHCMPASERPEAVAEIARILSPGGVLYSRFFTPRGAAWIRLQPMQVDRFGLTPAEVGSLLDGPLRCESLRQEGPAIYARAVKP